MITFITSYSAIRSPNGSEETDPGWAALATDSALGFDKCGIVRRLTSALRSRAWVLVQVFSMHG